MSRASRKTGTRRQPRTPPPAGIPPFLGHAVNLLLTEHEAFAAEVDRQLASTGFEYVRDAAVGGLEFDFAVYAPDREAVIVLEMKSLVGDPEQLANRAIALARQARDSSGANAVFLVTTRRVELPEEAIDAGLRLVVVDELAVALKVAFSSFGVSERGGSGQATATIQHASDDATLFAAMPFSSEFDDTYFVAIAGAAKNLGLSARRVDQEEYVGDVVTRIKAAIGSSRVVVADLSDQRPNVMYEIGLADGLGVPVVHVSRGQATDLPFDVAHQNTIFYEAGRTAQLIDPLTSRIRAALANRLEVSLPVGSPDHTELRRRPSARPFD